MTIGDDCVLWSGNHIGHHATIGDHCFITSHVVVSGHVASAVLLPRRQRHVPRRDSVGGANVVGAGRADMKSTQDGSTRDAREPAARTR